MQQPGGRCWCKKISPWPPSHHPSSRRSCDFFEVCPEKKKPKTSLFSMNNWKKLAFFGHFFLKDVFFVEGVEKRAGVFWDILKVELSLAR